MKQHRYHRNGRSIHISLNGLVLVIEIREGKNILEKREKQCKNKSQAYVTYKLACKRLFPAFLHDELVLTSELGENSRR